MGIQVTPEAAAVLRRSLELGGLGAEAGIRLRAGLSLGTGVGVQVELAEAPASHETVASAGGVRLFVDPAVTAAFPDALVELEEPHDRVVVRAAPARGDNS